MAVLGLLLMAAALAWLLRRWLIRPVTDIVRALDTATGETASAAAQCAIAAQSRAKPFPSSARVAPWPGPGREQADRHERPIARVR